jgi:hypothetical protein
VFVEAMATELRLISASAVSAPSISLIWPSSLRARTVNLDALRAKEEARLSLVNKLSDEAKEECGTVIFFLKLRRSRGAISI